MCSDFSLNIFSLNNILYQWVVFIPIRSMRFSYRGRSSFSGPFPYYYVILPGIHSGKITTASFVCLCVVCFLPIHSGHEVRWTYQPGSQRRRVTQDFSSTFFLRCVP